MREQEAVELARHIQREDPLFVVQEIGWRVRDRAWALKVFDTITERQAVITDAQTWPRMRSIARAEQRQALHRVVDQATTLQLKRKPGNIRRDESLRIVS